MTLILPEVATTAEKFGGCVTCPLCHMTHATTAIDAVGKGAGWRCARCGQRWDAARLGRVAEYAAWAAEHDQPLLIARRATR